MNDEKRFATTGHLPLITATPMDDVTMQERYRALLQAARNLFSLTSLDDLVENILKYSRVMMQAEACSMFLPERATRELILYSARGRDDAINAFRIPWDKGIAGMVFQERKFVRIDDAQNDPRLLRTADQKSGFVTRAMLCAPLVDKGDCFGVLQALNPVGRPAFTQLDQDIFEGLTNIVTGALVRFDRELKIDQETKLARELSLAMEIQKSYLPPEVLVLPRTEMHVRYRPARTIGGDFYASIKLPGDRLLAALGDVSGKGIPAALSTAQITTEMQALAPLAEQGLSAYVGALNDALCQRLGAGRFAATTFLLYDPGRETMEVICAGQFEPWRWQNDTWQPVSAPHTLALGIFPKFTFTATEFSCQPGEKWLLFSDGINEGRNRAGEEFGADRLRASLGDGSVANVLSHAWQCWDDFVDADHQHDDACLALILTKPPPVLEISSAVGNCKFCRQFIEQWAQAAGFPDLERGRIVLAADEAVTNIIRHTYGGCDQQRITLSASIDDGMLRLQMRDYGPPVDPAKLKGRELEDIKPGGLGLHLLQAVFSEVSHQPLPDGNEWRLAKPLA
jgi:sigma-B regulation protein RsbU (phosphoserine phosphatase)